MAIEVFIRRRVKQGDHAKKLVPLILQMRAMELHQPGYISGETLCDLENPGDCLVINKWETDDDWNRWKQNKERTHLESKIEALTGETHYNIYAAMTVSQTGR